MKHEYYIDNIQYFSKKYPKGDLHRDDGPALIIYDNNGYSVYIGYFKCGMLHSIDGAGYKYVNISPYSEEEGFMLFGIRYNYNEWRFIVDNNQGDVFLKNWPNDFKMIHKLKYA